MFQRKNPPVMVFDRDGNFLSAWGTGEVTDPHGLKIVDDIAANYFPMPKDASGQDAILVGRVRQDLSDPSGKSIAMFVAGDQLLKGAALNAVQIAECVRAH